MVTSPWTLENRRVFAIVSELYQRADTPVRTEGWDLSDDRELAVAAAHVVGTHLLSGTIHAMTGRPAKPSRRSERAAWKRIERDPGAAGAVFLTRSAAAFLSAESESETAWIDDAARALEAVYAPLAGEFEAIGTVVELVLERRASPVVRKATDRGGTAATDALLDGQALLSYRALELAGLDPSDMRGFQPVRELSESEWIGVMDSDWRVSALQLGYWWKRAKEVFAEFAAGAYQR